jgi:hypothetical protein
MVRLFLIGVLLLGLGFLVHSKGPSPAASAVAGAQAVQQAPQPPAIDPATSYQITQNDYAYLNNYIKRVAESRAYREGTSQQKVQLPSGVVVEMDVQKTKAGYCPRRREMLYSTSVSTKKPLIMK